MSGGAVGAMILPPVAAALIGALGWRGTFAALGGMVLVIGLPMVALVVRDRPQTGSSAGRAYAGQTVREAMSSRVFWILVTVLFCSSIAQNGAITHISACRRNQRPCF
jgi:predicted MFS family arabinose efflux permease